jgi:hypothetical protein
MNTLRTALVSIALTALVLVGAPANAAPVTIDDVPNADGIIWAEGSRSTHFEVSWNDGTGYLVTFPRLRHMQRLCNDTHGTNTPESNACRLEWRALYAEFVAFRDGGATMPPVEKNVNCKWRGFCPA